MEVSGQRRSFKWSKEARDLVRANLHAKADEFSGLLSDLEGLTGNPRDACSRFARAMGVKYKKPYRVWSSGESEKLVEYSESRSRSDIATTLHRSRKAIELKQRSLGITATMQKDGFSKHHLAELLHIRPRTIQTWVDKGWLPATIGGTPRLGRILIAAEDFIQFCRKYPEAIHQRRINQARLEFVFRFAFPPHHSGLFTVREAKKEHAAYEEQVGESKDFCEFAEDFGRENDAPPTAA
jgi:hypothetical protein